MQRRNDWQLRPTRDFDEGDQRRMWTYCARAVSYVDHYLDLLLEALVDTDPFGDTLFIFSSDHGEMLCSRGMLLKGLVLFDELMRMPLLIRPPGNGTGGRVNDSLVSHAALVPTVRSGCGIDVPDGPHGSDISAPVNGGRGTGPRRAGLPVLLFQLGRAADAAAVLADRALEVRRIASRWRGVLRRAGGPRRDAQPHR